MKYLLLLLFIPSTILGQNFVATYVFTAKEINPKNQVDKQYYILDVVGLQSAFRSENQRNSDSIQSNGGRGTMRPLIYEQQIFIQKNLASQSVTKTYISPQSHVKLYTEENLKLDWSIKPEQSVIAGIQCQKAEVDYGGRQWIAWFSQLYPTSEGPYVFHGLPGLIIKVEDKEQQFSFELTGIKQSKVNNLFLLDIGKKISKEKYAEIRKNYYSDPFSYLKSSGIPFKVADSQGNEIDMNLNQLSQTIRRQIKAANNIIDLTEKINY